jgi:O-acetyl-ADP-ribose deacetylase (regulator of RNase III)
MPEKTLLFVKGDITEFEADIIVNAANSGLAGGGVDGAIHRAAGPAVMRELDQIRAKIGRCLPGGAVVTGAGNLRARHIIHAVGPIYNGGRSGEAQLLARCYEESVRLADQLGARSIVFPAISWGAYRFPMREAAEIAVRSVRSGLMASGSLEIAHFVLFDAAALQTFRLAASNH